MCMTPKGALELKPEMHVFQRGALARRRIVRFALTSATVLVLAGLAVLVAGVVSSDGGPVLPAFVGPLQRVLAPAPPPATSAPTARPPSTASPAPTTTGPASSPPAAPPRTGRPSNSPNGPPSSFPGHTQSPPP